LGRRRDVAAGFSLRQHGLESCATAVFSEWRVLTKQKTKAKTKNSKLKMFDRLSDKLAAVFKKLRGRGKLSEADVNEALREVRLSLLEADVNYKVTKAFIDRLRERAVGEEVMRSLTPAQQVVKIVHEELTALLSGGDAA
jgi:signal recognition particle GTPase